MDRLTFTRDESEAVRRLSLHQRIVCFDAVFTAVRSHAQEMGAGRPDMSCCPCCGRAGGGVRRAQFQEARRFYCVGGKGDGCGFVGGPLDWIMAGGLGESFTNPDQARKALILLFEPLGWAPVWPEGSAC